MLDRIASAIQRTLQSDSVVCVARNFFTPPVRFIYDGFQFFQCERRLRNQIPLLVHPGTVRHVNLNPVAPMPELLSRAFARSHWAVAALRALPPLASGHPAFHLVSPRAAT